MNSAADDKTVDAAEAVAALGLLDPRIHAVLANPLRHEIVMRTSARPWSPTELIEATGRTKWHVEKALRELKSVNLIELVEKRPGPKGGWVYLYRASRFVLHAEEWERLSDATQASATGKIEAELHRDLATAIETGGYAHPNHAMIRDHRRLDDPAMERCAEILTRAWEEIVEAEEESLGRCNGDGEPPLVVLGLAALPGAPEPPSE